MNCIDECSCSALNTDICDKVTGLCNCKEGWNETNCTIDVDECSNADACPENSNCINSNGSYACICQVGYVLADDKCIGNMHNISFSGKNVSFVYL